MQYYVAHESRGSRVRASERVALKDSLTNVALAENNIDPSRVIIKLEMGIIVRGGLHLIQVNWTT